jgi:hypothetical protein
MSKRPRSDDIDNAKPALSDPAAGPFHRMTGETRRSPVLHLEYAKAPVVTPLPPRNPGLSAAALRSLRGEIEDNLEGLEEISEMTSLRLQMTMERRSKFVSILSQTIKKIGSTQETLVQNIK